MPMFRKLTPQEAGLLSGLGVRKVIEIEYDTLLSGFGPGDFGEVILEEGEKRLTVMNRLKAAAKRADVGLVFRRSSNPQLLRFQVLEPDRSARIAESLASKPRRDGRLKKQS
jgi:hypothetical protein